MLLPSHVTSHVLSILSALSLRFLTPTRRSRNPTVLVALRVSLAPHARRPTQSPEAMLLQKSLAAIVGVDRDILLGQIRAVHSALGIARCEVNLNLDAPLARRVGQ